VDVENAAANKLAYVGILANGELEEQVGYSGVEMEDVIELAEATEAWSKLSCPFGWAVLCPQRT